MLTKSNLQSLIQCPRKLWLEQHRPESMTPADATASRRTADGNVVGEKSRAQLGERFLWPAATEDKLASTRNAWAQLTRAPDMPAVEMPMVNGHLYARADAVLPTADGYVLRETKASTFRLKPDKVTPAEPEAHHLDDLAIQAWAFQGTGQRLARAELNLLDSRWRYPGEDDYAGLFRQLDVTTEVTARMAKVPSWIQQAMDVLAGAMPAATTGAQCSTPHECPFSSFCAGLEPPGAEHPIELLPGSAGKRLARKLKTRHGYQSILEPGAEQLTGASELLYRRIQQAHRTASAVMEPGCAEILAALPYPRYYFDFEGIDLPVPRWRGVRPYEQIPFQWSCHVERTEGVFDHASFLDLSGEDPSLACIESMRRVIDPHDDGPLIVYYATYERGRLEALGERHPEHAGLMQRYVARLFDLHPVVKSHFYHPAMQGSFSIKEVLPVIAPDLGYEALSNVRNGTDAQLAYLRAALTRDLGPEESERLEAAMLSYCEQDTWAMVEIAHFLAARNRPRRSHRSLRIVSP